MIEHVVAKRHAPVRFPKNAMSCEKDEELPCEGWPESWMLCRLRTGISVR